MRRDYKTFFAICKAIGREKEDVVLEFTDGRTNSLSALNDGEFKELMIQLRRLQPTPKTWTAPPGDAQRKKMIGIARNMQWGRDTIEIVRRLDEWCVQTFKMKMNDMDLSTLGKAVTIFENKVYTGYLKGIQQHEANI